MSTVVQVLCTPHDPTLPGAAARGTDAPEPLQQTIGHFATLRARLAAAEPDVLVVVSGDHLNQWFYDNMPTFSIGKAVRARGPAVVIPPYDGVAGTGYDEGLAVYRDTENFSSMRAAAAASPSTRHRSAVVKLSTMHAASGIAMKAMNSSSAGEMNAYPARVSRWRFAVRKADSVAGRVAAMVAGTGSPPPRGRSS